MGKDAVQRHLGVYRHVFVRMFIHSTCTQTVRWGPIALGLVISFASDTRYSIGDVRVTLPGYLALLLHVLSTGASEHLRSALLPSVGAKYVSVFCTIGAATFGLIIYATTEILVSIFIIIIRVISTSRVLASDQCATVSACSVVLSFGHPTGGIFYSIRA